jgi:hypothetical protein
VSLTRTITIWCDGRRCTSWAESIEKARELRSYLRRGGWSRVDGKDYCPACSKKRQKKGQQ